MFSVLIFLVSFVFAAPYAQSEEIRLEELLVQERPEGPLRQASISVLTARDLKKKNAQTVAEALRGTLGVDVASSGGFGQPTSVFIRGSKSEHTLVLIDGVEANDPTTTTRFFDFSSLTVENIDRIEVYRGAQGAYFGPDAIGGVINIITKKGAGPLAGSANVAAGSYDLKKIGGALGGSDGHFSYSASASHLRALGFSAANAGDGDESDGVVRTAVSSRLDWDFADDTSVTTTLRFIDAATKLDASGGPSGDDPNYDSTSRQILSSVRAQTKFFGNLTSSVGAFYNSTNRQYDNSPNPGSSTDYHETFHSDAVKIETRQNLEVSQASRIEYAIQYRQEEGRSDQTYNAVASRQPSHRQSIFGESLQYHLSLPRLTVEAGLRHDQVSVNGDSILTPSVSASYEILPDATMARFNYGAGFKNPSLFQLYSNFGSTDLQSEKAETWDAAIEQKLTDGARVSVTYFSNRFTNLIDFNTTTSKYANIAKASSSGVELQVALSPVEPLILRLTGKSLSTRDESTGLELLRRPRWSYEVTAEWNKTDWGADLCYRYAGDRDDLDPITFGRIRLPGYEVLGAGAHYAFSKIWDISLRFENIMNRNYEDIAGYRTAGRSFLAGLRASF